jgi:hypothetical protein
MDVSDRADSEIESSIQEAMYQASKKSANLKPNGICHYCQETVEGLQLFCDSDCATDHDKLINRSR